MKHNLPYVRAVKEVVSFEVEDSFEHKGHFTLIAPDPMAGRRSGYSVIRINYETGKTKVLGREVPLGLARKLAKTAR